jgi:hypothetical protein
MDTLFIFTCQTKYIQGDSEISLEKKSGVSLTQNNSASMTFGGEIIRMEITLYPCIFNAYE